MACHRRRAAIREGEFFTVRQLGERDGWRCHICRRKVDQALGWPHRMSPSIDHLIPLAEGGSHTLSNAKLAHMVCNARRGVRGIAQLLLIG